MQPIDKFTNLDAVYPTTDAREEDIILDYVWDFAMFIHPAEAKIIDDRFALEGSYAIPTFKKRYNEGLIDMPLTYKEYRKMMNCRLPFQLWEWTLINSGLPYYL